MQLLLDANTNPSFGMLSYQEIWRLLAMVVVLCFPYIGTSVEAPAEMKFDMFDRDAGVLPAHFRTRFKVYSSAPRTL